MMRDEKLDVAEFIPKWKAINEDVTTVRRATGDNFAVLLATDNYVQKYLPFKTQEQISENILSILNRPLFNNKRKLIDMSAEEKKHLQRYQNYRTREQHILNKLHEVVMEDNGQPTLGKR